MMPTTVAIFDLIDVCRMHNQIGLVQGAPGVGKSFAIAEKARREPAVCLVRIPRVARTLQPCLLRIAAAVGAIVPANSAAMDVHHAIVDALPASDDFVLVIDEAQNMEPDAFVAMQDLRDEADIPIVLVGNPVLGDRLTSRKSPRIYGSFGPLRARIGPSLLFERPSKADVVALCEHFGVTGAHDRKVVHAAASMEGGLHKVERLIAMARGEANAAGAIRSSYLNAAAVTMGVPQ